MGFIGACDSFPSGLVMEEEIGKAFLAACTRNFSTTHSTSDKTFFIPASGYRYSSSSRLSDVSSDGSCWSAAPDNASSGYDLNFLSSYVGPQSHDDRTYGFSVRPVQE